MVLGIKPRALCRLGMCSVTKLVFQAQDSRALTKISAPEWQERDFHSSPDVQHTQPFQTLKRFLLLELSVGNWAVEGASLPIPCMVGTAVKGSLTCCHSLHQQQRELQGKKTMESVPGTP